MVQSPSTQKNVNKIQIGTFEINDIEIDVGTLPKDHSGLLALDILKNYNFIIDMAMLELHTNRLNNNLS